MLNLGIDLHGVLEKYPHIFNEILLSSRDKIWTHILTGPRTKDVLEELEALGLHKDYHYKEIFSVVDYLIRSKLNPWEDEKGWWAKDEDWWSAKGIHCTQRKIDIMIDDSEKYAEYMPDFTKFILVRNLKDAVKAANEIINEIMKAK